MLNQIHGMKITKLSWQIRKNLENEIIDASSKLLLHKSLPEFFLLPLSKELDQLKAELNEKVVNFREEFFQQVIDFRPPEIDFNVQYEEEQQGFSSQRIQQFKIFQTDESFTGDQCPICIENVKTGRNVMRLDCDGHHTFCQVCIENCFADHNTCPFVSNNSKNFIFYNNFSLTLL